MWFFEIKRKSQKVLAIIRGVKPGSKLVINGRVFYVATMKYEGDRTEVTLVSNESAYEMNYI